MSDVNTLDPLPVTLQCIESGFGDNVNLSNSSTCHAHASLAWLAVHQQDGTLIVLRNGRHGIDVNVAVISNAESVLTLPDVVDFRWLGDMWRPTLVTSSNTSIIDIYVFDQCVDDSYNDIYDDNDSDMTWLFEDIMKDDIIIIRRVHITPTSWNSYISHKDSMESNDNMKVVIVPSMAASAVTMVCVDDKLLFELSLRSTCVTIVRHSCFQRIIDEESALRNAFISVCYVNSMFFGMQTNGSVLIFDIISGVYIGIVDAFKYLATSMNNKKFSLANRLSVSEDLSRLAIIVNIGSVVVVDLNRYFERFPGDRDVTGLKVIRSRHCHLTLCKEDSDIVMKSLSTLSNARPVLHPSVSGYVDELWSTELISKTETVDILLALQRRLESWHLWQWYEYDGLLSSSTLALRNNVISTSSGDCNIDDQFQYDVAINEYLNNPRRSFSVYDSSPSISQPLPELLESKQECNTSDRISCQIDATVSDVGSTISFVQCVYLLPMSVVVVYRIGGGGIYFKGRDHRDDKLLNWQYTSTSTTVPILVNPALNGSTISNALFLVQRQRSAAIVALLPGFTRDTVLDTVLISEGAAVAERLCRVNNWDHRALLLHSLDVALRSHLVVVVQELLHRLEPEQWHGACERIIAALKPNSPSLHYSAFTEELQHVATTFIVGLIRSHSNANTSSNSVDDELTVEVFLKFLLQIRASTKGSGEETGMSVASAVPNIGFDESKTVLDNLTSSSNESFNDERNDDLRNELPQYLLVGADKETERLLSSWKLKSDHDVISEAIKLYCMPLAQTFLLQRGSSPESVSLNTIERIGIELSKKELKEQKLDTAIYILRGIGHDPTTYIRALCFDTANSVLRRFLWESLEHGNNLTVRELETLRFVESLECAHDTEDTSFWKNIVAYRSHESSEDDMNTHTYTWVLARWVLSWNDEFRHRIIIDTQNNFDSSSIALSRHSNMISGDYCVDHISISSIVSDIKNLIPDIWMLDSEEAVVAASAGAETANRMWGSSLSTSPSFLREIVYRELARRGVTINGSVSSTDDLIVWLACSGRLFDNPHPLTHVALSAISLSSFHRAFERFCIQNNASNLLLFYLARHDVVLNPDDDVGALPAWVHTLNRLHTVGRSDNDGKRIQEALFHASLSNAFDVISKDDVILSSEVKATVSEMAASNRSVMALATLLYAPISILGATDVDTDVSFHVSLPALIDLVTTQFHSLHVSLYNSVVAASLKNDGDSSSSLLKSLPPKKSLSIYELLSGNVPFHVKKFFDRRHEGLELLHFSSSSLASRGLRCDLDFSYYLLKGRPYTAWRTLQQVAGVDVSVILRRVYSIALGAFLNMRIIAACVMFIDLLDTERGQTGSSLPHLRIDVATACRIFSHAVASADGPTTAWTDWNNELLDVHNSRYCTLANAITADFVEMFDLENAPSALIAKSLLTRLVAATDAMETAKCHARTPLRLGDNALLTSCHNWSLVHFFSNAHELPHSTVLLERSASANAWLEFLMYAQLSCTPPYIALSVASSSFSDVILRQHVCAVICAIQDETCNNETTHTSAATLLTPNARPRVCSVSGSRDFRSNFYSSLGLGGSRDDLNSSSGDGSRSPSMIFSADGLVSPRPSLSRQFSASDDSVVMVERCSEFDSDDVYDILFTCSRSSTPARTILLHAYETMRPFLAAAAVCHHNAVIFECFVTWLVTMCPRDAIPFASGWFNGGDGVTITEEHDSDMINDVTHNDNTLSLLPLSKSTIQWHSFSLDDLESIIVSLVDLRVFRPLIDGFKLFDPDNTIISLLSFIETFWQWNFDKSGIYLCEFTDAIDKPVVREDRNGDVDENYQSISGDHVPAASMRIGNVTWFKRVSDTLVSKMLRQCAMHFERSNLLRMLANNWHNDHYRCLHRTFTILETAELDVASVSGAVDANNIIDILVQKMLFEEARAYANEFTLVRHDIAISEATARMRDLRSTMLWDIESARVTFWGQCHSLFMEHSCDSGMAGDFFLLQAEETENISEFSSAEFCGMSTPVPSADVSILDHPRISTTAGPSAQECIRLFTLALAWFNGTSADTSPCRSPDVLQELENRIWLITVAVEAETGHKEDMNCRRPGSSCNGDSESFVSFSRSPRITESFHHISPPHLIDMENVFRCGKHDDIRDFPLPMPLLSVFAGSDTSSMLEYYQQAPYLREVSSLPSLSISGDLSIESEYARTDERRKEQLSKGLASTGHEIKALNAVVARLLDHGSVVQAQNLCSQFKHSSMDLLITMSMILLAEGTLTPLELRQDIKARLSFELLNSFDVEAEDIRDTNMMMPLKITPLLNALVGLIDRSQRCGERILLSVHIAEILSMSYREVVTKDPCEILQCLFFCGRHVFSLAQSFINLSGLSTLSVAKLLADVFYSSLLQLHEPKPISGVNLNIMNSASMIGGILSSEEFTEFSHLCDDPLVLGNELVAIISSTAGLDFAIEVELLIRAHFTYDLVCSLDGMASVMRLISSRVREYVDAEEFQLLVRLLTGVKKYREMQYIFDELLRNERFELILGKFIDKEGQLELKMAVYDYLKCNHPNDQEKLNMVFLHFNMYREIGQSFFDDAYDRLWVLRNRNLSSSAARSELFQILQLFSEAAESFLKEECLVLASQSMAMTRLIALQTTMTDLCIVNLNPLEVSNFMNVHSNFCEALVVAEAYELNRISEWVAPVYNQVILQNNFAYLDDFKRVLSVPDSLYLDILSRVKVAPLTKTFHINNMKRLLDGIENVEIRFSIARDLLFEDVTTSLLASHAILRDSVRNV